MNHLRFHSWCPPEAAFNVADEMGFYVQVELPVWSVTLGKDSATVEFLRAEAKRISKEYGNHPSFCFWSIGNELQYDFNILASMLGEMKAADDRHLYTTTSFTFEKVTATGRKTRMISSSLSGPRKAEYVDREYSIRNCRHSIKISVHL